MSKTEGAVVILVGSEDDEVSLSRSKVNVKVNNFDTGG